MYVRARQGRGGSWHLGSVSKPLYHVVAQYGPLMKSGSALGCRAHSAWPDFCALRATSFSLFLVALCPWVHFTMLLSADHRRGKVGFRAQT